MSLYHQLETVEIPSIVALKPSQYLENYGIVKPRLEFSPTPTQLFKGEDPQTVLQKEQPAQLLQPPISVVAVTQGPDTFVAADRQTQMQNNAPRRLVYDNEDVSI